MDPLKPALPIPLARPPVTTPAGSGPIDTFAGSAPAPPISMPTAVPIAQKLPLAATVYAPHADGTFTETRKIPCLDENRIVSRPAHLAFASPDGTALTQVDERGRVEFQVPLDGSRIDDLLYDPPRDRYLIRTGTGLHAIDAATGEPAGRVAFGSTNYGRRVLLQDDGTVLLADDKELKTLDASLVQQDSRPLPARVDRLTRLQDGSLCIESNDLDPAVLVLGPGGKTLLDAPSIALYSLVTAADGKMWFVKRADREHRDDKTVVRYDPSRHDQTSFKAPRDAASVVPLRDGRSVVFDDHLAQPRISVFSAAGSAEKHVDFGNDVYLRQFIVSRDEKEAMAVVDRYPEGGHTERMLYRFSLDAEDGILTGLFAAAAAAVGHGESPEPIYIEKGDQHQILPALLEDGRILVFKKDSIDLLDPQGHVRQTFHGVNELLADPVSHVAVSGRRVRVSMNGEDAIGDSMDEVLQAASHEFGYPTRPAVPPASNRYTASDRCLNFTRTLPAAEGLAALGFHEEQDLVNLAASNALFNYALHPQVEMPLADPQDGKLKIGQQAIDVAAADGTVQARIESGASFLTALPVTIGPRHYVAAALDDRTVRWYDGRDGKEIACYDAGARVVRLQPSDDRILAVTETGSIVVLSPDIPPGQAMRAPTVDGQANLIPPAKAGTIERGPRQVVISGVSIPLQNKV